MNNVPPAIAQALAPWTPPMTVSITDYYYVRRRHGEYEQILLTGELLPTDELLEVVFPPDSEPYCRTVWHGTIREALDGGIMVMPSLVVPCPACDGGWRDTPTGTVMCGQCRGSGVRATNGGEP